MKSQMDDMVFIMNGKPVNLEPVEVTIDHDGMVVGTDWGSEGYSGTLTFTGFDQEQFMASITPYNQHFKRIRMPDGKLLTRGKNKWNLNYIK